jgi:hypothetical protein
MDHGLCQNVVVRVGAPPVRGAFELHATGLKVMYTELDINLLPDVNPSPRSAPSST